MSNQWVIKTKESKDIEIDEENGGINASVLQSIDSTFEAINNSCRQANNRDIPIARHMTDYLLSLLNDNIIDGYCVEIKDNKSSLRVKVEKANSGIYKSIWMEYNIE